MGRLKNEAQQAQQCQGTTQTGSRCRKMTNSPCCLCSAHMHTPPEAASTTCAGAASTTCAGLSTDGACTDTQLSSDKPCHPPSEDPANCQGKTHRQGLQQLSEDMAGIGSLLHPPMKAARQPPSPADSIAPETAAAQHKLTEAPSCPGRSSEQCAGLTKDGAQCKSAAADASGYCRRHGKLHCEAKPGAERVSVRGVMMSCGMVIKPKSEYVDVDDILPGATALVTAERGLLLHSRSAFVSSFPEDPGVYVWSIRAPGFDWSPVYCGKADGCQGLRGRMRKYHKDAAPGAVLARHIIGPVDSTPGTVGYKFKTEQVIDALTRGCDVKVCYKAITSGKPAKDVETDILAAYDFPCNHMENTAQVGSYRYIEVCKDVRSSQSIKKRLELRSLPVVQITPIRAAT